MAAKLRVLVYTLDLPRYACAQLRILQIASCFSSELELLWGVKSDGNDYAIDDSLVDTADLILFQRYFPMAETRPVVERALASGAPVIYECDDDFLHIPEGHPMRERLIGNVEHIEYLARRAHAVTTTTAELASRFKELSRDIRVLPNLLDPGLWGLDSKLPQPERSGLCIGVSGTASHMDDLEIIRPALEHVAQKYRGGVRLFFYGLLPEWAANLPGVESLPFDDDYVRYAKRLRRLDLDLALVPLADTPFNRSKSAIKYLEYAACGVPGVFSEVTPYTLTVEHGRTGLLAGPDPQGWIEGVDLLLRDPEKRRALARDARRHVADEFHMVRRGRIFPDTWRAISNLRETT
jgi:glycosyltransferase involved in cell wall biosynthesis